jgi:tetratricopeptide (TPR) repeat protein
MARCPNGIRDPAPISRTACVRDALGKEVAALKSFRNAVAGVFVCLLVISEALAQRSTVELKSLYKEHRWFELRDAIAGNAGTPFYRGAVECAFSQLDKCETDLHKVADSRLDVKEAVEAHRILISAYFRMGKYHAALQEADALLALDPTDSDTKGDYPLLQLLGQSADQLVRRKGDSVLKIQEHGLPVLINARSASYWFDTGANLSVISESEARRVGLLTRTVESNVGVMTGAKVRFRVAVADRVELGNFQLENVAFLVFPDDQQPFNSLPQESRGLLGMPVLLALGQVSFGPDRHFVITPKEMNTSVTRQNMCFDGKNPIALLEYDNRQLSFTLDTGASNTDLYPRFAAAFPELLQRGKRRSSKMEGVGSTEELNSVVLPNLRLTIDGFSAVLKPATVLLKENGESSKFFYGNLGIDLLMQPRRTTLDFTTMRLSIQE